MCRFVDSKKGIYTSTAGNYYFIVGRFIRKEVTISLWYRLLKHMDAVSDAPFYQPKVSYVKPDHLPLFLLIHYIPAIIHSAMLYLQMPVFMADLVRWIRDGTFPLLSFDSFSEEDKQNLARIGRGNYWWNTSVPFFHYYPGRLIFRRESQVSNI